MAAQLQTKHPMFYKKFSRVPLHLPKEVIEPSSERKCNRKTQDAASSYKVTFF